MNNPASPDSVAGSLPMRTFGRTGLKVSLLAIGCGNRLHMAYGREDRAVEAVRLALDCGINYMDTAQSYGDGLSETWVGIATKDRRENLVLASKTLARTADEVMHRVELSLKRLQTSHLDVLHIHGLKYEDDLAEIEAKGGALEALYKLRDQKIIRFIGVTSHADPATLATALNRHDFDCTQMALNAGLQGLSPDGAGLWKIDPKDLFSEALPPPPCPGASFQEIALPVAVRKNLGIVAMKVTAQEGLIGNGPGKAAAHDLLRYSLSLPVSLATIGMPKLEFIRANTDFARSFRPMPASEMQEMASRVAAANKAAVDTHFREHQDA
jgi:predicted oxidoreductase